MWISGIATVSSLLTESHDRSSSALLLPEHLHGRNAACSSGGKVACIQGHDEERGGDTEVGEGIPSLDTEEESFRWTAGEKSPRQSHKDTKGAGSKGKGPRWCPTVPKR